MLWHGHSTIGNFFKIVDLCKWQNDRQMNSNKIRWNSKMNNIQSANITSRNIQSVNIQSVNIQYGRAQCGCNLQGMVKQILSRDAGYQLDSNFVYTK